jgi:hypothetical protein
MESENNFRFRCGGNCYRAQVRELRRIGEVGELHCGHAQCHGFGKNFAGKNLESVIRHIRAFYQMRRRTFQRLKAASESKLHHHVYVVLLDAKAAKDRKILKANPKRDKSKPCVYVGMTGLTPEERFQNHKSGIKAARVVQKFGIRLLPELYECFNPMPFEAAVEMERDLAEELRDAGYTVAGGC